MDIWLACGTGLKEDDWIVYDYLTNCKIRPTVSEVVEATKMDERKVDRSMRRIAFQSCLYAARRSFLAYSIKETT